MKPMPDESALSASMLIPAPPAATAAASHGYPRRVYERWRRAAHAVGVVQTRVIMVMIYATVVVPTGVFMRLTRDPLHLKMPAESNWTAVRQNARTVESARQQG
jgi:polyferredoxin